MGPGQTEKVFDLTLDLFCAQGFQPDFPTIEKELGYGSIHEADNMLQTPVAHLHFTTLAAPVYTAEHGTEL